LNGVKATEPALLTLREITQATLGFSTPYDASSSEHESRMKSLVKEELQKNEGDLPEDLSRWLQQQSTEVQIECMEGLDKLECLRKEELRKSQQLLEFPALPSSKQGSQGNSWSAVTRNKKQEEQQRPRHAPHVHRQAANQAQYRFVRCTASSLRWQLGALG
jgi:hypothetical protein